LNYCVDEDMLQEFFQTKTGGVTSCRVIREAKTQQSRGFGFVEFETTQHAAEALKQDGAVMDGRELKVNYSQPKSNLRNRRDRNNFNKNDGYYRNRMANQQPYGGYGPPQYFYPNIPQNYQQAAFGYNPHMNPQSSSYNSMHQGYQSPMKNSNSSNSMNSSGQAQTLTSPEQNYNNFPVGSYPSPEQNHQQMYPASQMFQTNAQQMYSMYGQPYFQQSQQGYTIPSDSGTHSDTNAQMPTTQSDKDLDATQAAFEGLNLGQQQPDGSSNAPTPEQDPRHLLNQ